MPELPDVEAFKAILDESAIGKRIARVSVSDARILRGLPARTLARRLGGKALSASRRHGKHLLARIESDGWLTLHFGMTGALQALAPGEADPPYSRLRLDFADRSALAYSDLRLLGRVGLADDADAFIAAEKLGPDALDPKLDLAAFRGAIAGSKRDVKSVLMDQEVLAGIGNIWADEILFTARIHPRHRIDTLEKRRIAALHAAIRHVLRRAVAAGAGSERFAERAPKGWLIRERRKGGHCPRCGRPLTILKIGGRTTYCCERDQS